MPVPGGEHQPAGPVLAVLLELARLEHAEGLAGECGGARGVGVVLPGVEDVCEFAVGDVVHGEEPLRWIP